MRDATLALRRLLTRQFNARNRMASETSADNGTTSYQYDQNGNVTVVQDPLGYTTRSFYDEFNRPYRVEDPGGGVTQYQFDRFDHLTQVTDGRNLFTTYGFNGIGDLTQTTSPDTGITILTFHPTGQLWTSTDARGVTATHTYDALYRRTTLTYSDGSQIVFTYDGTVTQRGRLARVADATGSRAFEYSPHGRPTRTGQTTGGIAYTTQYNYDTSGRLFEIIYPSGSIVRYSFDAADRISGLTVDGITRLSNIRYVPFGPPDSWQWGTGTSSARPYNTDGRLTSFPVGSATWSVGYNLNGSVTSLGPSSNPTSYTYDAMERLRTVSGALQQDYTYDVVGNRRTRAQAAGTNIYPYAPTSNRLLSSTGPSGRTMTSDAAGNLRSDGLITYTYDARGRLTNASTTAFTATSQVNGLGQRVAKTVVTTTASTTRHFVYDLQGQLLGEYDGNGALLWEVVYLGNMPVAVLTNTGDYDVHTDHLHAPRALLDAQRRMVWR